MNNHLEKTFNVIQAHISNDDLQTAKSHILKNSNNDSLSMKVLSIIGGFLSTVALLAFMFIAQVFNSGQAMFIFGIACIVVSYIIHFKRENLVFETVSVTLYMAGYILFSVGLIDLKIDESLLCIILIIMSLISISTIKNQLLIILSVLLFNAAFFALYNIHDIRQMLYIHLSLVTIIVYILYYYESIFLAQSKLVKRIYHPVRIGFSFVYIFSFIGFHLFQYWVLGQVYNYVLTFTIMFCNILLLYNILHNMNIYHLWQRYVIIGVVLLLLAPTYMYHGIAASLLLILLCYYAQYAIGVIISAIMFVYYISRFYYDLHYTLLFKSIILILSGLLFLTFYFITKKYFATNEKI